MGRIVPPPDIERIFNKPGSQWTPEERNRVIRWLFEDQQLKFLLSFALRHLGHGATAQDAEDAWQAFCDKGLDGVMRTYNPTEGRRFWNWLLLCFERFCHKKGKSIRKKRKREVPLETKSADEEVERLRAELVDKGPSVDPGEALEEQEKLLAVRKVVWKCMSELKPRYYTVVVLYYFEEKSVAEIAEELGISESTVKVRLYRARHQLAECLQQEG